MLNNQDTRGVAWPCFDSLEWELSAFLCNNSWQFSQLPVINWSSSLNVSVSHLLLLTSCILYFYTTNQKNMPLILGITLANVDWFLINSFAVGLSNKYAVRTFLYSQTLHILHLTHYCPLRNEWISSHFLILKTIINGLQMRLIRLCRLTLKQLTTWLHIHCVSEKLIYD